MGKKGSYFLRDSMNIINFGGVKKEKEVSCHPKQKNVSFAFQKRKNKFTLNKAQNV